MVTIFLVVTTGVCGIGWLKNRVSMFTLLAYMMDKNLPMPTDAEINKYTVFVIKRMFRIKDQNGL